MLSWKSEKVNNTLLIVGSIAVGVDFIPLLVGKAYFPGPSLAWMVFPVLLPLSIIYKRPEYFSRRVHLVIFPVAWCLLIYSVNASPYESIVPPDWQIYANVKMAVNSLIIYAFFYVHSKSARSRMIFIYCLIFVAVLALLIKTLGALGVMPGAVRPIHLGKSVYLYRISAFGDANITTIYLIAGVCCLSILSLRFGSRRAFLAWIPIACASLWVTLLAASRGGIIALVATLFLVLLIGAIRKSKFRGTCIKQRGQVFILDKQRDKGL